MNNNSEVEDGLGNGPEPDGLMADAVGELELEKYSEFFHDLGDAIDADECNRFIRAVSKQVREGIPHGFRYLLTVHKTFLITTEEFKLADEQKRELVRVLLSCAAKPYDEPMSFESLLLDEEQVEFARLVADAIFQTSATIDIIFGDRRWTPHLPKAGNAEKL